MRGRGKLPDPSPSPASLNLRLKSNEAGRGLPYGNPTPAKDRWRAQDEPSGTD